MCLLVYGTGAAVRVDAVGGGPVSDPHVEPGGVPANSPTRLIGRDLRRRLHLVQDSLVIRFQPGRRPRVVRGAGPTGRVSANRRGEARRHLLALKTRNSAQ